MIQTMVYRASEDKKNKKIILYLGMLFVVFVRFAVQRDFGITELKLERHSHKL